MSATKEQSPPVPRSQMISAMFLVAGTCIGGGMLALPVGSSPCGFLPSIVIMSLSGLAMALSGLLLTEVGFWMKKDDAHVISMSRQFLGTQGKNTSWLLYLFICYASMIAYTAGCGHMLASWGKALGIEISKGMGCVLFALSFGPIVFLSHRILGRVNSYLFIAMCCAFVFLIGFSAPHIKIENLERSDWNYIWSVIPLLLTSFSFQTMVPSLHPYLKHNPKALRTAIIGGIAIAFFVYFIWQLIVHGAVPFEGAYGLKAALAAGEPATHSLSATVENPLIDLLAHGFSFFALITSFLGIALGLYDFLSDGLVIPKKGYGNVKLGLLILIPTLFFAITYDRIFLLALDISGGIGDSILNGMIPIAMIVVGRYIMKREQNPLYVRGGKFLLGALFLFFLGALVIELLLRFGYLSYSFDLMEME